MDLTGTRVITSKVSLSCNRSWRCDFKFLIMLEGKGKWKFVLDYSHYNGMPIKMIPTNSLLWVESGKLPQRISYMVLKPSLSHYGICLVWGLFMENKLHSNCVHRKLKCSTKHAIVSCKTLIAQDAWWPCSTTHDQGDRRLTNAASDRVISKSYGGTHQGRISAILASRGQWPRWYRASQRRSTTCQASRAGTKRCTTINSTPQMVISIHGLSVGFTLGSQEATL